MLNYQRVESINQWFGLPKPADFWFEGSNVDHPLIEIRGSSNYLFHAKKKNRKWLIPLVSNFDTPCPIWAASGTWQLRTPRQAGPGSKRLDPKYDGLLNH